MILKILFASVFSVILQTAFFIEMSQSSLAQEWKVREKPRGIVKVSVSNSPAVVLIWNYAEGLVIFDNNNELVPGLAQDYRWINNRTIEFILRQGVTFQNGEKFDANAVKINWEEYRKLDSPRVGSFYVIPDETIFQIIDEYTVR